MEVYTCFSSRRKLSEKCDLWAAEGKGLQGTMEEMNEGKEFKFNREALGWFLGGKGLTQDTVKAKGRDV